MSKILLLSLLCAAGCGGQLATDDDGAADEAALAGKADAVADATTSVTGIYQLSSSAGEILYAWLRPDGEFAWTRCYDAGCAAPVVEDGTFKLTTSSGKKYVTFYQIGPAGDLKTHFNSMYEYTRTTRTLKLRLVRTSTWQTLSSVAESTMCKASGGKWSGGALRLRRRLADRLQPRRGRLLARARRRRIGLRRHPRQLERRRNQRRRHLLRLRLRPRPHGAAAASPASPRSSSRRRGPAPVAPPAPRADTSLRRCRREGRTSAARGCATRAASCSR